MVGQTDIKQAIAQFQVATNAAMTVAFVDLQSCMVLAANSKKSQAQEYLDELAQDAKRMLDNTAIQALSGAVFGQSSPDECWQSDGHGTRLYLAGPQADEALVFVMSRKTDRATFVRSARRLGNLVWGG